MVTWHIISIPLCPFPTCLPVQCGHMTLVQPIQAPLNLLPSSHNAMLQPGLLLCFHGNWPIYICVTPILTFDWTIVYLTYLTPTVHYFYFLISRDVHLVQVTILCVSRS